MNACGGLAPSGTPPRPRSRPFARTPRRPPPRCATPATRWWASAHPPSTTASRSAGWAALVEWAGREADAREAALPAARVRYREVQDVHATAERALQSAEEVAERAAPRGDRGRAGRTGSQRARRAARTARPRARRRPARCARRRRGGRGAGRGSASWRTRSGRPTPRCGRRGRQRAPPKTRRRPWSARSPPRGPSCAPPAIRWSPSTPPPSATISSARGRSSWPGRGPRPKNVPRERTGPTQAAPRSRPAAAPSSGGSSTTSPPTTSRWRRSTAPNRPHRDARWRHRSRQRGRRPAGGASPPQRWAVLSSHRPQRLHR